MDGHRDLQRKSQSLVGADRSSAHASFGNTASTAFWRLLADRRDMLTARLAFDGAELNYDQTLSDYSVLRGATYTDLASGITLATDNPFLPTTPHVKGTHGVLCCVTGFDADGCYARSRGSSQRAWGSA